MSTATKAVLANIGLVIVGIYGAVGLGYFFAWVLPFVSPAIPVLMANFLLIPVGLLFVFLIVLIPTGLLVLAMSALTGLVHRSIGLKCCG